MSNFLSRRARGVALVAPMLGAIGSASAADAIAPVPAALTQPAVQSPSATSAAMLCVTRAGARLVAGGERGVVLLSDDEGRSWRQARTPVRTSLTALQFVDDRQGWALGHLGVILHTRDGGASWTRQMDGLQLATLFRQAAEALAGTPEAGAAAAYAQLLADDGPDKPWLGLHFSDARHGIVVGAYNLALRTQDGGATWQPLSQRLANPKGLHLYGVRAQGRTVLIHGEQGLLLRSDDAGASFAAVASPYKGTWFGLLPLGDGEWLAYGLRGNAYRSSEQGQRWQALTTGLGASITSALRLHDGRLLLVSQTGEVLVSDPAGGTLERRGMLGAAVAEVAETADGALVAATLRGPLRASLRPALR